MDYVVFLSRLADIFDRSISQDARDFSIGAGEWDSLATLASIALLHEAFGRKFPIKLLQSCNSAKEVYELGTLDKGKEADV